MNVCPRLSVFCCAMQIRGLAMGRSPTQVLSKYLKGSTVSAVNYESGSTANRCRQRNGLQWRHVSHVTPKCTATCVILHGAMTRVWNWNLCTVSRNTGRESTERERERERERGVIITVSASFNEQRCAQSHGPHKSPFLCRKRD